MAENSKIEWTHHTFNPWIGCQKVGPGCDLCYAEARDKRFTGGSMWGPHAPRQRTSAANWRQPLKWDRDAAAAGERRRVFCASLADVFDNHASVDAGEWRDDLWRLIWATPNLDWMLLTKRPGNIAGMLPQEGIDNPAWGDGWPNVWLGCTVINQAEADRDIPKLLAVPAKIRFLSMEPLLGSVYLLPYLHPVTIRRSGFQGPGRLLQPALDLVIVGGESGPRARPMHPDWARSLRDQCQAAGTAFHFKQWGEWEVAIDRERDDPDWRMDYSRKLADRGKTKWLNLAGGCGFQGDRFHVMRRAGRKRAGRMLDGRTWDQMPGGAA